MEKKDELYPVGHDDHYRVCAWYDDHWGKPDARGVRPFLRHLECGVRFRQWNLNANDEPWAYCLKHAEDDRKPKKVKGS